MSSRRLYLLCGLISGLIGGLALCLPMAAGAGDWTVKAGTSAQVAGSCLAIVNLMGEADGMTGPERPDYREMAWTWVDHIIEGDAAFAEAAMEATEVTVIRYDDLARTGDAEGRMASLRSEMAACLDLMPVAEAGDPPPEGADPRP